MRVMRRGGAEAGGWCGGAGLRAGGGNGSTSACFRLIALAMGPTSIFQYRGASTTTVEFCILTQRHHLEAPDTAAASSRRPRPGDFNDFNDFGVGIQRNPRAKANPRAEEPGLPQPTDWIPLAKRGGTRTRGLATRTTGNCQPCPRTRTTHGQYTPRGELRRIAERIAIIFNQPRAQDPPPQCVLY